MFTQFEDKIFSAVMLLLIVMFGFLIVHSIMGNQDVKRQTYECISKNGTLIEGKDMNFCVEKFIPLEPDK